MTALPKEQQNKQSKQNKCTVMIASAIVDVNPTSHKDLNFSQGLNSYI